MTCNCTIASRHTPIINNVKKRPALRMESVQMLRGIAVLMVLFYHVGVYEVKASDIMVFGNLLEVGKAGVDIFFVISGFVMVTISSRSKNGDSKPGSFLLKRAIRIYPLYWFYTAISLAIFLIRPDLANRSGGVVQTSLLHSVFLLPDKSGAPIVGQGWTLIHEMYFYLIFALILFARPFFRVPLLIAWALVVASVTYAWQPSWSGLRPSISVALGLAFHPLTLEFIGGCLIAMLSLRGWHRMGKPAFAIGALLLLSETLPTCPWTNLPREFAYGIPAFFIVYGAISMERTVGFTGPQFLRRVGDASYSIYLSHIISLSACLFVWKSVHIHGLVDDLLMLLTMVIISLAVGFFSYFYIERLLQSISRKFLKICLRTPAFAGLVLFFSNVILHAGHYISSPSRLYTPSYGFLWDGCVKALMTHQLIC